MDEECPNCDEFEEEKEFDVDEESGEAPHVSGVWVSKLAPKAADDLVVSKRNTLPT